MSETLESGSVESPSEESVAPAPRKEPTPVTQIKSADETSLHPSGFGATLSADSGVSVGSSVTATTPSEEATNDGPGQNPPQEQESEHNSDSSAAHSSDEDLPDLIEAEDIEARVTSRRKRLRLGARPGAEDESASDVDSSASEESGPRGAARTRSPTIDPDEPYDIICPRWNHAVAVRQREHGLSAKRADFCDSHFFVRRIELMYKMDGHKGCVNCLNFNRAGTRLLSGSDDMKVAIWDWTVNQPLTVFQSGHRGNVFQTKYLPGDAHIVTASRDGQVRLADLSVTGECRGTRRIAYHKGAVHKVSIACEDEVPLVLTCGEDGVVMSVDLRDDKASRLTTVKDAETGNSRVPLYSIHSNPVDSQIFAVGGRDQFCRIYDRRSTGQPLKSFCPAHLKTIERHKANVTGAVFSHDGSLILATYNDEDIYCFDTSHSDGAEPIHRYRGHRNNQTVKSVAWMGARSKFVMSGSDCGHLYIWDRDTEQILQILYADETGVVNTMEMNPRFPMIASSGLDSDVKIWVPSDDKYNLNVLKMRKLTRQNERERAEEAEQSVDGLFSSDMIQFIMSRYSAGRRLAGDDDSSPEASSSDEDGEGGRGVIGCRTS